MNDLIKKVKPVNYSAGNTYIEYGGESVEVEVYIGDDLMTIYVELEADHIREELSISKIEAEMFDEEGNEISTDGIDLENLVIEIFEAKNTFAQAENAMAEAHKDYYA